MDANSLVWLDSTQGPQHVRQTIRKTAARWSHRHDSTRKPLRLAQQAKRKCRCELLERRTSDDSTAGKRPRRPCQCFEQPPGLLQLAAPLGNLGLPLVHDQFVSVLVPLGGQRSTGFLSAVSRSSENNGLVNECLSTIVMGLCSKSSAQLGTLHGSVLQRYTKVIGHVQKGVLATQQSTNGPPWLETVLSIFILSLIELLVWNDPRKWMLHLKGLADILASRDPQDFRSGIAFLTFRTVRPYLLALDLFRRRSSFLTDSGWVDIPWDDKIPKTSLDTIMDNLLQFPNLLMLYDCCTKGTESIEKLQEKVSEYAIGLTQWKEAFVKNVPLNVKEEDEMHAVMAYLVDDQTAAPELAVSLAMYFAGWLLLVRLPAQYQARLPRPAHLMIRDITILCERYLGHEQQVGVLGWITPLRIAIFTPVTVPSKSLDDLRSQIDRQDDTNSKLIKSIVESLPGINTYIGFMQQKDRKIEAVEAPST